ncbi:MAG: helix-turn-helix domain-containing protein [Deltaproteobacteria bacterium]|nr:helix-turn-helix domain-containing protein [Deltaproteobacteria bacterium]
MESPGEHLKREREHRGVSLQKIFESTRVPMKYLEAIEADRVEGLPQTAFVKGYIRNYCKVLGLDENDAVLRYEVWLADRAAEAEAAGKPKSVQELKRKKSGGSGGSTKPEREFKAPPYLGKAAIIAAGIVLIILAYALTKRDLSAPEAPLPEPAVQAVVEPAVPGDAGQAVLPDPEPEPQAPQEAIPAVKPQKPASSGVPMVLAPPALKPVQQPAVKPALPVQPVQPVQKTTQPEPVKTEAPGPGAVNEGEARKAHTLIAKARDTVWLKVGIDKEEPVEVLLKQGERFTWKAAENISVIIGNAGGVTLTYNGRDISGLGASGEVVGLRLPSGTSYKIKTPQPSEPSESPDVAMPEAPEAAPSGE